MEYVCINYLTNMVLVIMSQCSYQPLKKGEDYCWLVFC